MPSEIPTTSTGSTVKHIRFPDILWARFIRHCKTKHGVTAAARLRYLMERDLDESS